MVPDLTAAAGAPRVAAIEFPFGRPLGRPGDADTQRGVLGATLEALSAAAAVGTVTHLPFVWPEPPDQVHWHPKEPSPISRLLGSDPSMFKGLVSGAIPAAASRREPDQRET
jgi:hypothetical protein